MTRRAATWLALILGAGLLAGAIQPAQAATARPASAARPVVPASLPTPSGQISGPTPVPAPAFDLAAGEACAFGVHIEFPVDREVAYTYTDSTGRVVAQYFTGALIARLRRVDTGSTLTVDASGSGVEVTDRNGNSTLYGVGPYLLTLRSGDSPSHELARPTGLSALRIDADGHKTLQYASQVTNLCRQLG